VTDRRSEPIHPESGREARRRCPRPKYPYTFKIVNQKDIKRLCATGGPIHINLGTIQAADNEAQLAGVMAHEMGHVIMRHSTHMASQQMMAQAPLAILGGLMGNGRGAQSPRWSVPSDWDRSSEVIRATLRTRPTSSAPASCMTPDTILRRWWSSFTN